MCGGPTDQQKQAATAATNLTNQEAAQYAAGTAVTTPFYSNLVNNPQQNPQLAQQYGQQKAQLASRNAGYGGALPSGFAEQQNTDLNESEAQAQANSMFGRQVAGAQGLNPQQAAGTALQGANSVMQAPLQNNFWSNLLGGLISGGSQLGSAYMMSPYQL